jgi:ferredoxin--NADP+ reductase
MLFIDPEACIDCGACMDECPVDAIYYEEDLPADQLSFLDINSQYFRQHPLEPAVAVAQTKHAPVAPGALRVAIVGAGPAACYAAAELVEIDNVEVNVFERLPTPFGLIRYGVAPDHQNTKAIVRIFERMFASDRATCYLNVEIGAQISHEELAAHHHAVIYAVGARHGRDLNIPGDDLAGVYRAADFVGWYNGQPDHRAHDIDLTGPRAVVIGNGNVALDIARVLLKPPASLAATDIVDHALNTLTRSGIREVVIVARRGFRDAAFSVGEFLALGNLDGVDVVIEDEDLSVHPDDGLEEKLKLEIAREYAEQPPDPGNKRMVFRFGVTPTEVVGTQRAEGLRVVPTGEADCGTVIDASLILTAIGYRADPVSGVPYDAARGVVANNAGRAVDDTGTVVPGVYVTGWVKRGPRGVIGTNRACAVETVSYLLADFDNGKLARALAAPEGLSNLLARRGATPLTWEQWQSIDAEERRRGAETARPRVKFVDVAEMLAAAAD